MPEKFSDPPPEAEAQGQRVAASWRLVDTATCHPWRMRKTKGKLGRTGTKLVGLAAAITLPASGWHGFSFSFFSDYYYFLFLIYFFFYFTILYWFCHTLTWICHGYTCVPHPEPPSHLSPHPIPLGHPSARAPSILYPASNLNWRFIYYMILYMFQCHAPKSSHLLPLPQSPKDYSIHLCLFCCLSYRVIITIFLNSIYIC